MKGMNKKFFNRTVTLLVAAVLMILPSGCSNQASNDSTENVTISIGRWPTSDRVKDLANFETIYDMMKEKYPNIEIIRDTWEYDVKTFLPKANSNQLPSLYNAYFTELGKIMDAGYAADITEYMEKYHYTENMNPNLLEMVTKDGKIYGVPKSPYMQGMGANKNLFAAAGLLNDDGTVKFPETYLELAETAKIIKQKTGKYGFGLASMNNQGGWYFMNIAWSFGVEFMKEENGKWISTFDSPECVEALQYIKDLKWVYECLPDNAFLDRKELYKLMATDQLAMTFTVPPAGELFKEYGMEKSALSISKLPAGPKGKYSQVGGEALMISPNSTPEQIDAIFKWLECEGLSPEVTEETKAKWDANNKNNADQGQIVLPEIPFKVWTDGDRMRAEEEIQKKYANVDFADYAGYFDQTGILLKPEEPVAAQQLYSILDSCIQAVLTDKNADVAALIAKASSDFQINHLDMMD